MGFKENLDMAWKLILAIILYTLQHHAFAVVLPDSASVLQTQTNALNAFKDALANPFALGSWNDRDPCSGKWEGIICSSNNDSVIKISLQGSKFFGPVPKEIKRLDFLEGLVIMNTAFTGELPAVIDTLRKLKSLIVSKNPSISGEFPKSILNLKQIENLDLSWNNFTGTLPGLSNFASPPLKQWISFLSNLNGNSLDWNKLVSGIWPLLMLPHGPWIPFLTPCSSNPFNWTWLPSTYPSSSHFPFTFPAPMLAAPMLNLTTFASLMNLTLPPSTTTALPIVLHWPSMNVTDGNVSFPSKFTWPSFNQKTPLPFQSFWQDANASILHFLSVLNGTIPSMFNWTLLLPELENETVLPLLHLLWPALNLSTPFILNWPLQYLSGTFPLNWNMTCLPVNISFPPELNPLNMTWTPMVNLTIPPPSILFPPLINWTLIVPSTPPPSSVNFTSSPPNIPYPPFIIVLSPPPPSSVNFTSSPPSIPYPPFIVVPSSPPPSSVNFTSSPPSISYPPFIVVPSSPPPSSVNFTSSPPSISYPPFIIVLSPPPPSSVNFTSSPSSMPYPPFIFVSSPPPPSVSKFPPPPPSWKLNFSVPFLPPPITLPFPKLNPPTPTLPPLFSWTWPPPKQEMLRKSLEVQTFEDIPNLTHLDLSHNTFVGAVPKELETLARLHYLNLSNNLFFGETPFTLFKSPRIIDLSNNFLSGNLTSAAQFSKSITLDLSGNCLTGVDPSGELAADQKIWIQNNCLDTAVKCKCVF